MAKRTSSKETMSNLFNRYVWLTDLIYRRRKITFEEINEAWSRSELNYSGVDIPLKTFHNHRHAIEAMFDINIECNRKGGYYYYIENADDVERGGVRQWLINTFAVNNLINESHKLKSRILFEQIPSGQRFLTTIIEAMRDGVAVEVGYQSFSADEPHTAILQPYCLKVFKQRWYVVANNGDNIRIYSLDRISEIATTSQSYILPEDFNGDTFFANAYGIIVDERIKPEEVVIKAYGVKAKYIDSLPLHSSQKVIEQNETYTTFAMHLSPTYDLKQELLSHGAEVEVVSPAWFREEIKNVIAKQFEMYK
ncbi:MAG: WYL domain-containing protein [Rikenellaceae bacterium]